MMIKLSPELEAALGESARRRGMSPDELANELLAERFLASRASSPPKDAWERIVVELATDCGVSLPHSALGSESLYE